MADRRFSHSLPLPTARRSSNVGGIELNDRTASVSTGHTRFNAQVSRRQKNHNAIIENPLAHLQDEELIADVHYFHQTYLQKVDIKALLRAARVAKDARTYDEVARAEDVGAGYDLPVQLTDEEKAALKAEKDVLFSERGMLIIILTVSLAAFLQGFVQSSINGASLYPSSFGLYLDQQLASNGTQPFATIDFTGDNWKLGAANASPYLFAALLGCWLSLPINDRIGRRGAMTVAACLIFGSSLGAAFCRSWIALFLVRIINGIGMGIKAVSTPILASETAVGFWRGSSILAWQLWVAFGIMMGFAFNLIFATSGNSELTFSLILGAPFVPALFLLVGLYFCPESPRYYMRRRSSSFNPPKAYDILCRLRNTELQALRDTYLVYKSVQLEEYGEKFDMENQADQTRRGFLSHVKGYLMQYKELVTVRRLRNALISSSTVALAQQLCGINVLAFYSGTLFSHVNNPSIPDNTPNADSVRVAMIYSLGYGAVNFVFGLPAIRTIDTLGRRKWLTMTLPFMSLMMAGAAMSAAFITSSAALRTGVMALFVFLFAAAYSPGLGPIPFTLASESFPLSHREAGCAFAIAVNLLFAGLLSIFFPSIKQGLQDGGSLGLFSGLNIIAFVLVFLLVEETKRRSLEDLDLVFAVQKRVFIRHQVYKYLPWFFGRYILGRKTAKPSLYLDLIWGERRVSAGDPTMRNGHAEHIENVAATPASPIVSVPFNPGMMPPLSRTSTVDTDDTHA